MNLSSGHSFAPMNTTFPDRVIVYTENCSTQVKKKAYTHHHTPLFYNLASVCFAQTAGCVLDSLLASWRETNDHTHTHHACTHKVLHHHRQDGTTTGICCACVPVCNCLYVIQSSPLHKPVCLNFCVCLSLFGPYSSSVQSDCSYSRYTYKGGSVVLVYL